MSRMSVLEPVPVCDKGAERATCPTRWVHLRSMLTAPLLGSRTDMTVTSSSGKTTGPPSVGPSLS
jgi:hypothetical protein